MVIPNMCMVQKRFVNKWRRRGYLINAYTANMICEKNYLNALSIAYTTNSPLRECDPDPTDELGKPKKWCKKCLKKKENP